MKYVLMFFICGYSNSTSPGQCAWREVVVVQSQADCRNILYNGSYDFKLGQEKRYLLAGCFRKEPTVEK